jgi:hypothetical protein
VVWNQGVKVIDLGREAGTSYDLTGEFPFGAPAICGDAGVKTRGVVLEMTVRGAAGNLKCGDREERLEGAWTWRPGPVQDLGVREIRVEQVGLRLSRRSRMKRAFRGCFASAWARASPRSRAMAVASSP